MKNKLPLILAIAAALGAPIADAQDQRPPQPPAPDAQRPPVPPPDGERPPGHRPEGERGTGRAEGGRHFDGDRPFSPRGEGAGRDGTPRERGPERPQKPTPYIGVMTESVPPAMASQLELAEGFGLIVEEIVPDSPAAAAGVQRYDVLKLLNDQELTEPNQLAALVRNYGKDREVSLTILRKGQEQKLTLKVGERMMPERRASFTPSPGEFAPRLDAARERGEEFGRRMQENMRAFQERMREYQKRIEEWGKNPGAEKPPEPPKFENPGAPNAPDGQPRRAEPPRPLDLLRESRPGGAPQVRVDQDGAVTTWNTGHARVVVKDEKGEIELRSEDGHRTVVAKDPAGETIFTGPVDTEEQRQALPEPVRKKLAEIQVQTEAKAAAERSTGESSRRAQPPREVQ